MKKHEMSDVPGHVGVLIENETAALILKTQGIPDSPNDRRLTTANNQWYVGGKCGFHERTKIG